LPVFQIPDFRNAVIVARNPNSVKRATSYAERLRLGIAVIHGEEKSESEKDDGRNSPPPQEAHPHQRAMGLEMLPGIILLCSLFHHII
jgi:phosphoribosylpyrophosphate synthetase